MPGKILIVDDDVDFQEATRAALEAEGYTVVAASDSKQGMEVVRQEKPDLVILDVMMSWILDGVGMSNAMDSDPQLRQIPVIMVSSIASTEYASEFPTDQPLHVDDFMSKPLKSSDLVGKVKKILGGRVAT